MNRLTSGTVSLIALLVVSGCNNDPTEDLRGPVTRIQSTPSTLNVTQGKTKTIQVTALDDQGNLIPSAYEVSAVGSGISVKRDSSFFEQFVGDSLTVPATATTFQFIVSGIDLVSTSFVVSAAGQQITIPVVVAPDPAFAPISTVTSTGPNASDTTVITAPAGYVFNPDAAVTFDAGDAITLGVSDDGSQLFILPPPGATSKGIVSGLAAPYLPQAPVTDSTDVALTISTSVPPQPGTDDPTTAPVIALPPSGGTTAFYDGTAFGAGPCGVQSISPCQFYKITLPADGSFDASLAWSNTTDLGLYVFESDGTTLTDQACDDLGNAADGGAEACTITLAAGDYYIALVNFGPAYVPPDPAPDWLSLAISTP
jgi:pre-peptidase